MIELIIPLPGFKKRHLYTLNLNSVSAEELRQSYSKFSIGQLLEILDNKFEHTELAVTIAIAELSKRNVTEEDIKSYKENLINQAEIFVDRNIVDDLNLLQKHLFYFLWVPVLNTTFKQNFAEDGYALKLKQANYYALLGFIFFVLSVIISIQFNFPVLTTLAIWLIGIIPAYAFDELFNRQQQIKRLIAKFSKHEDDLVEKFPGEKE